MPTFHSAGSAAPSSTHQPHPSTSIILPTTQLRPSSVRHHYYQHFSELSSAQQFHFATRLKNWFHTDDFRDYFATHQPSADLQPLLRHNDFSTINHLAARRPFFLKYQNLFAIEATLFRIHHLLAEYHIDTRSQFAALYPVVELHQLAQRLLQDDAAFLTLSTWAVNTVYLATALFPTEDSPYPSSLDSSSVSATITQLAQKALALTAYIAPSPTGSTSHLASHPTSPFAHPTPDPLLLIYLYTHIILCASDFYLQPLLPEHLPLFRQMLDRATTLILQNQPSESSTPSGPTSTPHAHVSHMHHNNLILDVRIEYLVCAHMVGYTPPTSIVQPLQAECRALLRHAPYLIDHRRPSRYHTIDGAEHTNVLYIMSGLDD